MECTVDTDVTDSASVPVRLTFNGLGIPRCTSSRKPKKLWKRAIQKLQSVALDPWLDFPTHDIPVQTAVRHRYSAIKKKWVVDEIRIKMETVSFDRGAMRECFRLKKLPQHGLRSSDWQQASNYVAKRYLKTVNRQVYFDDVRLQMEAKLWGEAFNRQSPPKKVDIFQLSVIELQGREQAASDESNRVGHSSCVDSLVSLFHVERYMEGEYRKYNSNSGFVDEQLRNTPQAFSHFTFERSGHRLLVVDIQGVGDLYTDPQIHTSDGVGYSDGNLGPRGMAFFFHSHRCNPLCRYLGLTPFDLSPSELGTDCQNEKPQSEKSVDRDTSLDPLVVEPEQHGDFTGIVDNEFSSIDAWRVANAMTVEPKKAFLPVKEATLSPGLRRRCVSFSQPAQPSCRFGPTVARSTENMCNASHNRPRRHTDSILVSECLPSSCSDGVILDNLSLSNVLDDESMPFCTLAAFKVDKESPVGVPTDRPSLTSVFNTSPLAGSHNLLPITEHFPKLLLAIDSVSRAPFVRNRFASGDSGYSGRVNFITPPLGDSEPGAPRDNRVFFPHQILDPNADLMLGSTSSLIDYSLPTSPSTLNSVCSIAYPFSSSVFGATGEDYGVSQSVNHHSAFDWCHWNPSVRIGATPVGLFSRRHRSVSESSDLDADEVHRVSGNLLHQLMHESHKPSCTDHPTNLDQEIGQSILGQIHHELARLHEAGKFLPTCKGGWSHAGLGGLLLRDDLSAESAEAGVSEVHPTSRVAEQGIDWSAVLFHERHAAQLGCLEAMIVMAHYFLGLPTQLFFDCPIKPNQCDLRSGVDYLWRAAEGGDRRCMILIARYLDVTATMADAALGPNRATTNPHDFLLLPALQTVSLDMLPSVSPDSWAEAVMWYRKAVDTAIMSPDSAPDEGLDAEGRYDAAEDLLPVYRILGRMAEMYAVGGFGLERDFNVAGDLFNQAGELASAAFNGALATKYFDLSEEAYGNVQ